MPSTLVLVFQRINDERICVNEYSDRLLASTTEIKDLMDFAYLFAVLKDGRIRGQEW